MQYYRDELSKGVYYVLTLNPNKKFSQFEMFDELKSENVCPSFTDQIYMTRSLLKELSGAMSNASNEYNNVCYVDGKCYLKQKNKDIEAMEPIIRSERVKSLENIYSLDYNGDTFIHLLCRYGEDELLDIISKHHKIDFNKFNLKGESLFDVIPDENKTTLIMLVSIALQQSQNNSNIALNKVESLNHNLIRENTNLSTWNFRLTVVAFMMFVVLMSGYSVKLF